MILVTGDSGIGKSRLLSEFASRAATSGALVLIGECPPLGGGELPYAPIVGALRGVVRGGEDGALRGSSSELNRLFGAAVDVEPVEPLPADGAQARLFEQLLTVLLAAAGAAPLVLIIEDLQWADSSTQAFLTFLVRAAPPERFAAAAGRTIDHDLLATVSGLSEDDLAVALRDAVDSHVLAHSAPRSDYAFRHALLREAICSVWVVMISPEPAAEALLDTLRRDEPPMTAWPALGGRMGRCRGHRSDRRAHVLMKWCCLSTARMRAEQHRAL